MKKNMMLIFALTMLSLTLLALPALANNGNGNGQGNGNGGNSGNSNASNQACWGQATQVFARAGQMGYHASQQNEPRLGLANLADMLHDAGLIDEPTMQALGAFVSVDISACE